MKKRILVNRHVIRANKKNGKAEPPLSVQTYKGTHNATTVEIQGPSVLVYRPQKPLPCGATVWLETQSPVLLDSKLLL